MRKAAEARQQGNEAKQSVQKEEDSRQQPPRRTQSQSQKPIIKPRVKVKQKNAEGIAVQHNPAQGKFY